MGSTPGSPAVGSRPGGREARRRDAGRSPSTSTRCDSSSGPHRFGCTGDGMNTVYIGITVIEILAYGGERSTEWAPVRADADERHVTHQLTPTAWSAPTSA